ncbi:unnamed protein product [Triticum turgidum subsp. durum]|uniref:Uncharacterized protein n=1 Tax=Triticum turgidum subsp. durum TaxID=4567 RepID=A0A9R1NRF6_TRITD|nr:unnamed protein product [Triticum turgidum subsp. durum]
MATNTARQGYNSTARREGALKLAGLLSRKKRKKTGRRSRSRSLVAACVVEGDIAELGGLPHGGRRDRTWSERLPRARARARPEHGGQGDGVGVETHLEAEREEDEGESVKRRP